MSCIIRIIGTLETPPTPEELEEFLADTDFEASWESDDNMNGDEWTELSVFEESIDGSLVFVRITDEAEVVDDVNELNGLLSEFEEMQEVKPILDVLDSAVSEYYFEMGEDLASDDNALLLAAYVAQWIAQRVDGIYLMDGEGFFDENGDLIFDLATVEEPEE